MLPTLNGRIQTRIFLVGVVGSIWTIIITPVVALFVDAVPEPSLGQTYKVTFAILAIVLVLGILWEFVYQALMQFRWEKDWPTMFGYLTGINEGILAYLVAKALAEPYTGGTVTTANLLEGLTVTPYLIHFVSTWIVINLFAGNFMKMIFIRWRFRGGRLIGGW